MRLHDADRAAFSRIAATQPQWQGLRRVRDLLPEGERVLLHAGPAFAGPGEIPLPVLNSLAVACLYEGWTRDPKTARDMVLTGRVRVAPAQDHDLVVPLAGAASPSMAVVVVGDAAAPGRQKYAVLNEGNEHATRLGRFDPALPEHLHWLNGTFTGWLDPLLAQPIPLYPLIAASLKQGDDCHSRTMAGSALIAEILFARAGPDAVPAPVRAFWEGCPAFALNLWMAAAALVMATAEGAQGSALVTKAGGNGITFGFQVAGLPGRWFTAPAPAIRGNREEAHLDKSALGAIGDSAVVDLFGLGGQVLDLADASRAALQAHLPADALERPEKALSDRLDGLGGRLAVTDVRRVAASGAGPLVLLGMIEAGGQAGRIGGGVVDLPAAALTQALAPLDATAEA